MANNNNNNNDFNNFINYFNDYNKSIKDFEKTLKELNESIWSHQTSLERIKELQEEVNESTKNYKEKSLKSQINLQKEFNRRQEEGVTFLDDWQEKYERNTKAFRKGVKEIANGAKGIYTSITNTLKPWSEANDAAMKYARSMGMSQKTADKFLSNTVSWAAKNDIGILFNKSAKELIQLQGKYSEVLGRNVQLTDEQKKDMLAIETFLGEDGMMDIANNLENFGMGMSDSADFIKETMDEAAKSGVSASKLTKTIRENIKMAQNYSFKNGLDGLRNMAKKAIELKTNMSFINGFIEKTSTVEGAISTGAQLQVLGGNYAMGSDPLSMMYESLNNVEGLFDRAVSMAKGKVFYNNQTGNFEMGAMDRRMMKEAANAMGINSEEMINMAFRKASLSKIEDQIKNSGFSGDREMVEMVKNLATWNNGKAVVSIDGKDVEVGKLNAAEHKDKLEAMQRTDSQNLQEMAINLRSMNEIMSGVQKETENEQANMVKTAAEKINDSLRKHTELLNTIAKGGAILKIGNGIFGITTGIFHSVNGILRSINGVGNIFSSKPRNIAGTANGVTRGIKLNQFGGLFKKGGLREEVVTLKNGRKLIKIGDDFFEIGKKVTNNFTQNAARNAVTQGRSVKSWTNLAKSVGKGVKTGAGMGVFAAASSIGIDITTGEFKKDMGRSIGKATGPLVGSIIGGVFGPIGSIVGGYLGSVVTEGIQKAQDKKRGELRDEIANRLSKSMETAHLSELFSGDNALQGNYKKRQLYKLEDALKDGILSESDGLSKGVISKLKENGDLDRLKEHGISVRLEYANGGLLTGNSHTKGGMPILGSDIAVEGGEYVINKKATRENLPLLEKINNGDYKMTAREPLGKQMKVVGYDSGSLLPSSNLSNINIHPISINLSGTIKLDAGSKQFDISNEILNNPQLISKLTEMINKQINILDYGSYNKEKFKQKFI